MVLEKAETYVPALNNLAYLSAAGYGDRQEGLRLAISAFKQEPGNEGILDTLGFALLMNRRLDEAKRVLEKAVAALPGNPTVHYHLALAYKESGDRVAARRELDKALSLGECPDSAAARLLAAELDKQRG
jgi:Flp pilus assembly protein TadD